MVIALAAKKKPKLPLFTSGKPELGNEINELFGSKAKPRKKHPKSAWADGTRFPVIRNAEPTTGCDIKLGAKPNAITKKFRAEIARREKRLRKASEKLPSAGKYVGKGKKRRYVSNPKFTAKMATKLHTLAFTAERVRAEIEAEH